MRSGPGGLQTADRYYLRERGGTGLGERQEHICDLGQAGGAHPVPGPLSGLVGGGLHRVVHGPAGRAVHDAVEAATDQAAERTWNRMGAAGLAEVADVLLPLAQACAAALPEVIPVGRLQPTRP